MPLRNIKAITFTFFSSKENNKLKRGRKSSNSSKHRALKRGCLNILNHELTIRILELISPKMLGWTGKVVSHRATSRFPSSSIHYHFDIIKIAPIEQTGCVIYNVQSGSLFSYFLYIFLNLFSHSFIKFAFTSENHQYFGRYIICHTYINCETTTA